MASNFPFSNGPTERRDTFQQQFYRADRDDASHRASSKRHAPNTFQTTSPRRHAPYTTPVPPDRLSRFGIQQSLPQATIDAEATEASQRDGNFKSDNGDKVLRTDRSTSEEAIGFGELDDRYHIIQKPRSFFTKGRFLMTLWFEPERSGKQVGARIRRFIVIRAKAGHSICLPVHTYGGRGISKHGVTPSHHAAVIPVGGSVKLHEGESEMVKKPLRIIQEDPSITIDDTARINFAKMYTIEYTVKVRNIGRVAPADLKRLEVSFTETMNISTRSTHSSMAVVLSGLRVSLGRLGNLPRDNVAINEDFLRTIRITHLMSRGLEYGIPRETRAQAVFDTGSPINLISLPFVEKCNIRFDEAPMESFDLPNGSQFEAIGCNDIQWMMPEGRTWHDDRFYICDGDWPFDIVIGSDTLMKREVIRLQLFLGELRLELRRLRRLNANHRWYIPQRSLYELMTRDAIHTILQNSMTEMYNLDATVENIFQNGIKIFAILLLIDRATLVSKFIKIDQLQDPRLPFALSVLENDIDCTCADDFFERQWELLAPEFFCGTVIRSFDPWAPLPFTKDAPIGHRVFDTVHEVMIDQDHQEPTSKFSQRLVRKELLQVNDHKSEQEHLSNLHYPKHSNILELLTSYTYNNTYNLIFPLPEGGTLADLFETDSQSTQFESNVTFLIALAGLSSAIEHVHDLSERKIDLCLTNCHLDLRPANILLSQRTFILGDFGLSRFKASPESWNTSFTNGICDYLAPEWEDLRNGFPNADIRRSCDIWSFGCIIAEMATYLALGREGVQEFQEQRKFRRGDSTLSTFHCGPNKENPGVLNWLARLAIMPSSTSTMLVELIRRMLSMEHWERPNAKDVTARLRLISEW